MAQEEATPHFLPYDISARTMVRAFSPPNALSSRRRAPLTLKTSLSDSSIVSSTNSSANSYPNTTQPAKGTWAIHESGLAQRRMRSRSRLTPPVQTSSESLCPTVALPRHPSYQEENLSAEQSSLPLRPRISSRAILILGLRKMDALARASLTTVV